MPRPPDPAEVSPAPVKPPLPTPPPPTVAIPRDDGPAAAVAPPSATPNGQLIGTQQQLVTESLSPTELARRSDVARELRIRNVGAYPAWLGAFNVTVDTGRELRPHDPPLTVSAAGPLFATVREEMPTTLEIVVLA